jgi:hypothetical protein
MRSGPFYVLGVVAATLLLSAQPAQAQTTAVGPYYATPAWDQQFPCATVANCPRFVVLANWNSEAVLDRETGLVWERAPRGPGNPFAGRGVWVDAMNYCRGIVVGHRQGWRLPTVEELSTLLDVTGGTFDQTFNLPPGHPFMNVQPPPHPYYWSSTTSAQFQTAAYAVAFIPGDTGGVLGIFKTEANWMWCVRGGSGVDGF